MKNIDQEIEKLLKIKEELNKINEFKKTVGKYEIVSQFMFDFLNSKNLTRPDTYYYVTTHDVGQYIEEFRG